MRITIPKKPKNFYCKLLDDLFTILTIFDIIYIRTLNKEKS
jgi:hypothetical protein